MPTTVEPDLPAPKLEGGFDERREVIVCVVNGCPFELSTAHDLPDTRGVDSALGLAPGSMALQSAHSHHREIERTLHDHLASHNVLEWVRTVRSLQEALRNATATPHPASTRCTDCGRARTSNDEDYNPVQMITGRKLGWYSGDDGEICGACMTKLVHGG